MQQTGIDKSSQVDARIATAEREIAAKVSASTSPIVSPASIAMQSVRVFESALFSRARQLDSKQGMSLPRDTKYSSQSSSSEAHSNASEQGSGGDLGQRVDAESRRDQSGKGRDETPSDSQKDKLQSKANETSEAGKSSTSQSSQNALIRNQTSDSEKKQSKKPTENLDDVIAEVNSALVELGSMGKLGKKDRKEKNADEPTPIGFTLVELDDDDARFRKFQMFADDDDFMEQPWQIRFKEDVIYLEVFVKNPKHLPMMVKNAPSMEISLGEKTGLRVVLSFRTGSSVITV
jgi:hypothetical protein